jgi:hypothetical protein
MFSEMLFCGILIYQSSHFGMFVQHWSDRNSPGLAARHLQKLGSTLFVVLNGGFPLAFHLWMGKKIMLPIAVFFIEQKTKNKF